MDILKRILRRHWLLAGFLSLIAVAGIALASSAGLRHRLSHEWNRAAVSLGLMEAAAGAQKTYWCPMDPQIRSNKANAICPICGMTLVELEGDASATRDSLVLMPQQVQQAGVATETVRPRQLYKEINTTGRVAYDERRLKKITTWVRGRSRIDKLAVNFTGQQVKQGQLLAVLYSPNLIVAQNEYLTALGMADRRNADEFDKQNLEAASQKLKDQGMTAQQIATLKKTGKVVDRVKVFAEVGGTVIKRHVQQGDYITEGKTLFEIADLSHLWVMADIYEEEKQLIKVGMPVTLSVSSLGDAGIPGRVAFIDPMVNGETRTVPVRIEVENRNGKLSPGMFARVELRHRIPKTLAVPENAVLWSGKRTVVIVKAGAGNFIPREVQLGRKWLYAFRESSESDSESQKSAFVNSEKRYHEVTHGLHPGDDVVTAGAFLLNAESQFRNVLVKMLPPEQERVSLAKVVGRPVAERMEEVLDAYYKLSATLADDKIAEVDQRLSQLKKTAMQLQATAAGNGTAALKKDAKKFQKLMADVTATKVKTPKDARTRFGRISHDLTKLLAENGGKTLFGKSLHQFECGMAKVGYERWLWRTPNIHNPYMGKRMLNCGKKLDVLKP